MNTGMIGRWRKVLATLVGISVLGQVGLRAQLDDFSLRVPVRFKAIAKSPADQPIGEMTYFEAFLGDARIYGETWTRNTKRITWGGQTGKDPGI